MAVRSVAKNVVELPMAAGTGGDAKGVVDHAWIVAVDNAVGTVKCVAEDPNVSPVRERDGVGSIRPLPAEGFPGLGRKGRLAWSRRSVCMRREQEGRDDGKK